MGARHHNVWVALLIVVAIAGALQHTSRTDAQAPPVGAEVRLGARLSDDGSIRIGLQWRAGGLWRGTIPRLSTLPDGAGTGNWYASSTVSVPVRRIEVEIQLEDEVWNWEQSHGAIIVTAGSRAWRAGCGALRISLEPEALKLEDEETCDTWEYRPFASDIGERPNGEARQFVRVLARPVSDSVIELGLQRFVLGEWQLIEQPSQPSLALTSRNQWRFTESLALPLLPAIVNGELRPGVTISTQEGQLQVNVDGEVKDAQCGILELTTGTNTIRVETLSEDCQSRNTLFTVCETRQWCDHQQYQVYKWEDEYDAPAWIELSLKEMEPIVQAVYSDFVPNHAPPSAAMSDFRYSYWDQEDHQVYMAAEHNRFDIVLHETAHAIADGLGLHDEGHGPNYAATYLEVLRRYAPLVDTRVMRANAANMGVSVAEQGPRPVSDEGVEVVREIICGLGERGQEMCDAYGTQMVNVSNHSVEGGFIGGGRNGNISWHSDVDDDGSLWTSVSVYAHIDGQPESQANLQLACSREGQFLVRLWWPGEAELSGDVEYQIESFGLISDRWIVRQTPWTDEGHQFLQATRASEVMESLIWASSAGYTWSIRIKDAERAYQVTFDLAGSFDTPAQANLALCGLDPEQASAERFVGRGDLPYGWYGAGDDDYGLFRSYLYVESVEPRGEESVARLYIGCRTDNDLDAHVSWRGTEAVPPTLSYRVGDQPWRTARWRTSSNAQGEDKRAFHSPLDPVVFLHQMIWLAGGSEMLFVQYEDGETTYHASFDLTGAFDTPVQRNLALCGTRSEVRDPVAPVIDRGRFGENFWWGVTLADEENPRHDSYEPGTVVVTDIGLQTSLTDADEAIARLLFRCDRHLPTVGIYWEVSPAIDNTVRIGLADGQMESREWRTGTSNWGEYRFKWTGLDGTDALELWTTLYWAAQRGTLLTVESHAHNRPSQTYTATFDLDGLFDTPVQPNMARCGR